LKELQVYCTKKN